MPKVTYVPDKRARAAQSGRKPGKRSADLADNKRHISTLQRRELRDCVLWLKEQRGYRWVAKHTRGKARSHTWWQAIAIGRRDVIPTLLDLRAARQLYDIMQDEHDIDEQMLTLLLEVIEHRAALDGALTKLLQLVRSRSKGAQC